MPKSRILPRRSTLALQKIFGGHVRRARMDMHLSQPELSRLTGIRQQYISQIELGRINPTLDTMNALAEAFGLTVGAMLQGPSVKTSKK